MREYYLPWLVVEDLGANREIVVARFATEGLAQDFVNCRKEISYSKYIIHYEQDAVKTENK